MPESTVVIQSNGEYTLNSSVFSNVDLSRTIKSAKLYVRQIGIPTVPTYKIKLFHVNSLSEYSLVDASTSTLISGAITLVFDVSSALFEAKHLNGSLVIKNEGSSSLKIATGETLHLEIDYYNDANTDSRNIVGFEIPDYSLSFNHLTQNLLLKRKFYDGLLPYEFSIVYSSKLKDRQLLFLPKGYKVNLLDYLIIEKDNSNVITSITFVDKNNEEHSLVPLENVSNKWYTNDGSALILEVKTSTFELFNELSNAKKVFNSDGYLTTYTNEDEKNITITYSTSSITITDFNGNVILIEEDLFNFATYVSLNNGLVYTLSLAKDRLISISYDNNTYTDSFTCSGLLITSVTAYDSSSIIVTYTNGRVTNISKNFNSIKTDEFTLDYRYLKTIITNIAGVESFVSYNSNLDITQVGEVAANEEEPIVLATKHLVSGEYYIPVRSELKGRVLLDEQGYTLNSLTNPDTLHAFSLFSPNPPYTSIYQGGKYFLIATLTKPANISFGNNRTVSITVGHYHVGGGSTQANDIETFEFVDNVETQTIAILFTAPITEITSNDYDFYYARVEAQGFSNFGGVTFSNIIIMSAEGRIVSHYALKDSLHNNDMVIEGSPEVINNLNWYQIKEDVDIEGNEEFRYSYKDLVRNYLNVERETYYIWSEDLHKLTYAPYLYPYTSGGYLFRQHRNVATLNTVFAKKTIEKQWVDENDQVKSVYSFSYIKKDLNEDDEDIYILTTIKQIEDDTYIDTNIYDEDFKLVKESKSNGDITDYFYNSSNNLIKIESRNTQATGKYRKSYVYDNKDRVTTESELSSSDIVSRGTSYINQYLNLVSAATDEANNQESYTYDNFYRYIKKIAKGSAENNQLYLSNLSTQFTNSSTFKIERSISSTNDINTFRVKTGTSAFSTISSTNKETDYSGLSTYPVSISRYGFVYEYDKYNHLCRTRLGNNQIGKYYYFDDRPDSIETISATTFTEKSTSKAKLYRIDDVNRYTFYSYDDEDKLSILKHKIHLSGNNYETYTFTYDYDHTKRITNVTTTFSNLTISTDVEYENSNSKLITKVEHDYNTSDYVKDEFAYDKLSRKSSINTYVSIDGNYRRSLKEFVYYSKDITEGGNIVHLESPLIKRIDYSRTKNIVLQYFEFPVFSYDYSSHISYDVKGNITSIKTGTQTTPTSSSGVNYEYDVNNRLTREDNYDLNETIRYYYDNNGNITSVTHSDLNSSAINSTDSYSYNDKYYDKLVSFNNQSIAYDSCFNPTSYGTKSFSWSGNRWLTGISDSSNNLEVVNTYNSQGIRTVKKVRTTSSAHVPFTTHTYYLDGNRIIREKVTDLDLYGPNYTLTFLYSQEGVIGFIKDNLFYRYEKNIFGDVIAIYQSYNLIAKYVYDAYGNHKVYDGSTNAEITYSSNPTHIGIINPFRYRSYYFDVETGLYYCNSRYYNPVWRRWLSADDVNYFDFEHIDGYNLFAYCLNNPVMNVDPDGKSILIAALIGLFFGGVLSGGIEIGSQLIRNDWNWSRIDWAAVGRQAIIGAAIGFAGGAGGAALGGYLLGSATVSGVRSLAWLGISSVVSFAGGIGAYAVETFGHGSEWNLGEAIGSGFMGMAAGIMAFGAGGIHKLITGGGFLSSDFFLGKLTKFIFTFPLKFIEGKLIDNLS